MTESTPAAPTLLSPGEILEALAEDPTALQAIAKQQRLAAAALDPKPSAGTDAERIGHALVLVDAYLTTIEVTERPDTASSAMHLDIEERRLREIRAALRGEK